MSKNQQCCFELSYYGDSYYPEPFTKGSYSAKDWSVVGFSKSTSPGEGSVDNKYFFERGLSPEIITTTEQDFKEMHKEVVVYVKVDHPDGNALKKEYLSFIGSQNASTCPIHNFPLVTTPLNNIVKCRRLIKKIDKRKGETVTPCNKTAAFACPWCNCETFVCKSCNGVDVPLPSCQGGLASLVSDLIEQPKLLSKLKIEENVNDVHCFSSESPGNCESSVIGSVVLRNLLPCTGSWGRSSGTVVKDEYAIVDDDCGICCPHIEKVVGATIHEESPASTKFISSVAMDTLPVCQVEKWLLYRKLKRISGPSFTYTVGINCLYDIINFLVPQWNKRGCELRSACLSWVKTHLLFQGEWSSMFCECFKTMHQINDPHIYNCNSVEEYINLLASNINVYGTQLDLLFLSTVLHVTVEVFSATVTVSKGSDGTTECCPTTMF